VRCDKTATAADVTIPQVQYMQGCQISRFLRKLPEFEAHIMHVRIFDETPDFRKYLTFFRQRMAPKLTKQHR